uniref:Uncharacterized protein n=1 Tax=Romanomermis culicivorax TaxID=13658 RepID=A0A915LAN8_ROMCU
MQLCKFIKRLVCISQMKQWFTGAIGYWPERPMELEWVDSGNVGPIVKQSATSQFWGLGLVGFDMGKVKKAE